MFLPKLLSGHCIIKDSRDIPKIMKSAGYKYKEDKRTITLEELPRPFPRCQGVATTFKTVSCKLRFLEQTKF